MYHTAIVADAHPRTNSGADAPSGTEETTPAVRTRAPWKAWTGTERVLVRDNYQTKGAPWLAKKLGRTPEAVRTFAIKQGFGRNIDELRIPSTPAIDDYIRRVHANNPIKGFARICSKAIGRPTSWVHYRAAELGIISRPKAFVPWTDEERHFVMLHAHRTRAYISNLMRAKGWKRSPAAVHHFILHHRLADDGRYQGPEALSQCLGVSTSAIRGWANAGLLVARDRNCRKPGDPEPLRRVFDECDVARFIVQNPTKIDMRKVDGPWLIDLLARLGARAMGDGRDKAARIVATKDASPGKSNDEIAAMVGVNAASVASALSRDRSARRASEAA